MEEKELENIVGVCTALGMERTRVEALKGKDEVELLAHQLAYRNAAMQLLKLYEEIVPDHVRKVMDEVVKPDYIKKFHENFGRGIRYV